MVHSDPGPFCCKWPRGNSKSEASIYPKSEVLIKRYTPRHDIQYIYERMHDVQFTSVSICVCVYSLCSAEGHLKVVSAVGSGERGVVKGLWEEVMDQGTERHAITPTGREVLDVHILQEERRGEEYYIQSQSINQCFQMSLVTS